MRGPRSRAFWLPRTWLFPAFIDIPASDRDERPLAPHGSLVNRNSGEFLARARFAGDEDGRIGHRDWRTTSTVSPGSEVACRKTVLACSGGESCSMTLLSADISAKGCLSAFFQGRKSSRSDSIGMWLFRKSYGDPT